MVSIAPTSHRRKKRRTRNDRQTPTEVPEPDARNVDAVDTDHAIHGLNKTEERERERRLARARAAEDANLLARCDGKCQVVQNSREVNLRGRRCERGREKRRRRPETRRWNARRSG
jgi:hypothetical protein